MRTTVVLLTLTATAGLAGAAVADEVPAGGAFARTVELADGRTAQVSGKAQRDDAGNARLQRDVTVTDADGELVYQGHSGAAKNAAGERVRAQRGTHIDAEGNTIEVGRRGASDGNGNAVRQRAARVTDEDGNVVARGRDAGVNRDDGGKARSQKREYTDAAGNQVRKGRQGKTDGQGHGAARRGKVVRDADGNVSRGQRSRARQTEGRR